MAHPASLTRYPAEQIYLRHGATASLGLHLLVAGTIVLIAFLTHVKTIEQLMAEGGSIAQSGPAPEENIEVELRPDDLPPPPPTVNPEFINQVELPKPVVVPPPPVIVPPPKPVVVNKPRYTAPKATGTGESANISHLVVGSSGFPQPGYPYEAEVHHQTGTVFVGIQFDAQGNAGDVEVIGSSGVSILDSSTRSFIRSHWHNENFAGQHVTVPVEYRL
ncbi:MAG: energy transducer TonB [Methylacidiphilales bacterium]|nr:energy transducer TonB [Candidatus Methylacidiphilales bacterium]